MESESITHNDGNIYRWIRKECKCVLLILRNIHTNDDPMLSESELISYGLLSVALHCNNNNNNGINPKSICDNVLLW